MPFLSITRLRVRRPWHLPRFLAAARACIDQARVAPGLVAGATIFQFPSTFWTVTLWDDMPPMARYLGSGAHLHAMPRLREWCDEAAVAHGPTTGSELPAFSAVFEQLSAQPRFPTVTRPSARQAQREIPHGRRPIVSRFK